MNLSTWEYPSPNTRYHPTVVDQLLSAEMPNKTAPNWSKSTALAGAVFLLAGAVAEAPTIVSSTCSLTGSSADQQAVVPNLHSANSSEAFALDNHAANMLVRVLPKIITEIYGTISVSYCQLEDPDSGENTVQVMIESGLPLNEEFEVKDNALFTAIDNSGFSDGMRNVIISHA